MGAPIDPFGAAHGDQLMSRTLLIPPCRMEAGLRACSNVPKNLFGFFDQKMLQLVDCGQICLD
jgi:hypothetical protein